MRDYYGKHTDWYWTRYFELCSEMSTYKKAWQAVEEEHWQKFQFYKFEGYDSFRVEKSKRVNKKKPKTAKKKIPLFSPNNIK
jgi:hypothetical protein